MTRQLNSFSISFAVFFLIAIGILVSTAKASALSGADFNPGRIIDDSVFYNSNSMTAGQIQAFLNSKVPNCDYNGTQSASDWGHPNITHAQLAEYKRNGTNGFGQDTGFHAPPYKCLSVYTQNTPQMEAASGYCESIAAGTRTAAEIIKDVSGACGINPQVLMVLLEKEQSLMTDNWPLNRQLRNATGFACPDTAPCNPAYEGFYYQVYYAARQFKVYQKNPTLYNYIAGRNNIILWSPNTSCGSSTVFIQNQATAGLYIYTPYRPNQAALNNLYGRGDACSAYGNRNFWRIFNDWFGNSLGTIHNGVDYSPVFNAEYYLNNYTDLKAALNTSTAFNHFIGDGMNEGRQASSEFNVVSYRNRYSDLRWVFGNNLPIYYRHYAQYGKVEGRNGSAGAELVPVSSHKGKSYSKVYDFNYYISNNPDVQRTFGTSDTLTLMHFINNGMSEGRKAIDTFNVISYKNANSDLRRAFGNNYKLYYTHYISYGHSEGRIATGDYRGGTAKLNGVDYSKVYNFDYYTRRNPDVYNTFGMDDIATLKHFVLYGMREGRIATETFNVITYRNANLDLQRAFESHLDKYYIHYIRYGFNEGRTAT